MAMPTAANDTFDGKIYEQKVGERIDNFGGIVSRIIILFAPVKGGRDRMPVALL